jgi:hypothetical protein
MLKRIPKSDISVRPFKAYKEWTKTTASASVLIAQDSNYADTQMYPISMGHLSGSTYNKHSLYGQVKSTFYNGREDNPIERFGIKTNGFTIFTKAKERYLSGSATVISVPQKCVGEGIKRGSFVLDDGINQYVDDGYGNLSGQGINIVLDTINFDNEQITFYDLSANIISFEIFELNLENDTLNVRYNSEEYSLMLIKIDFENDVLEVDSIPFLDNIIDKIGNVFYNQGLIVLTDLVGFNTSSFDLNFKSTQTIYEHEYLLIVNEDEFNISQNPTAVVEIGRETSFITGSDNKIYKVTTNPGVKYIKKKSILENGSTLDYSIGSSIIPSISGGFDQYEYSSSLDSTGSYLAPFITTIGLYDDSCDLVAVAKLPQPIKSYPDLPVNFIVRFDT